VKAGAIMAIVSYGYVGVIEKALGRMGLGEYWNGCTIIGCDSQELTRVNGRKAKIVDDLRKKLQLASNQTLFVDDDPNNIRQANVANCSRTLGISPRRGMTEEHMCDVEKQVGVWIAAPTKNTTTATTTVTATTATVNNVNGNNHTNSPESKFAEDPIPKKTTETIVNNEIEDNNNNSNHKKNESNTGIVISSPRTVMDEASSKGKYRLDESEDSKSNENYEKTDTVDWSKYSVTVPKSLEQMWNPRNRENSDSCQDSPVVQVRSDSLDPSDDEEGPVLKLPPEMPSPNHS